MPKPSWLTPILLLSFLTLSVSACNLQQRLPNPAEAVRFQPAVTTTIDGTMVEATQGVEATPTETLPPSTPLSTLTPSRTLRPPPTFEPPTATRQATVPPTLTLPSSLVPRVSIPGLRGAETATPSTTPGCTLRADWGLRYTVQRDDALARIAERYNTNVRDLVAANCLTDANVIVIGQELRVPGDAQPVVPYDCSPWEVLTPREGAVGVPGEGQLVFNWRGPRAERNLIRIFRPDGSLLERVVDLRQNETIELNTIPQGGTYTWYVFPLDFNFVQVPCLEGGPWRFTKDTTPPTPTPLEAILPP